MDGGIAAFGRVRIRPPKSAVFGAYWRTNCARRTALGTRASGCKPPPAMEVPERGLQQSPRQLREGWRLDERIPRAAEVAAQAGERAPRAGVVVEDSGCS